jgi:hypothetical protein
MIFHLMYVMVSLLTYFLLEFNWIVFMLVRLLCSQYSQQGKSTLTREVFLLKIHREVKYHQKTHRIIHYPYDANAKKGIIKQETTGNHGKGFLGRI